MYEDDEDEGADRHHDRVVSEMGGAGDASGGTSSPIRGFARERELINRIQPIRRCQGREGRMGMLSLGGPDLVRKGLFDIFPPAKRRVFNPPGTGMDDPDIRCVASKDDKELDVYLDVIYQEEVHHPRKDVDEGSPSPPANLLRPKSAPVVTEQMVQFNEAMLVGDEADVIIRTLRRQDLALFQPSQWLTDPVVDHYLELIRQRSETQNGYMSVYLFGATFYSLLFTKKGNEKTKETTGTDDIFEYDLAFFPICFNQHWRLAVVNFHDHILRVYNSSKKTKDDQISLTIERFLMKEFQRKHPQREPIRWTRNTNNDKTPQQDNSDDCGIFILQFADYLSRGQPFDFGCEHMPYFRQRMLFECAAGQLLSHKQLE